MVKSYPQRTEGFVRGLDAKKLLELFDGEASISELLLSSRLGSGRRSYVSIGCDARCKGFCVVTVAFGTWDECHIAVVVSSFDNGAVCVAEAIGVGHSLGGGRE